MSKILVVDDEKNISDIIKFNLKKDGYETLTAYDGEEALKLVDAENPDLIILDLMLPKIDGLEVCKQVKERNNIPIIMLTAKDSELDKVVGLEVGADDYVTKPFSNRELLARVKAHLRRQDVIDNSASEDKQKEIKIGNLIIDRSSYVVTRDNNKIDLTHREFDLINYLAENLGKVITREQLLEMVWGYDYYGDARAVDVTVRRLRQKLEEDPSNPEYLVTRRGVGYFLNNFEK